MSINNITSKNKIEDRRERYRESEAMDKRRERKEKREEGGRKYCIYELH